MNDIRHENYFLFTQYSLATFENCPLKFKKRYMENLKWDGSISEDMKKRLEMGNDFHLLAYRYFMGIDTGLEKFSEEYGELNEWIDNLKKSFKKDSEIRYLPEYKLRMITSRLKLEANIDLLAVGKDTIEIWDWKTHGNSNAKKGAAEAKRLENSLQTMVYLFVLKEQAGLVAGTDVENSKICMYYWQPSPPRIITKIAYSDSMHNRFREALEGKVQFILNYDYSGFDKSLYSKHCKHCEFNWYCNNERVDFNAVAREDDFMDMLDWDSVEERV